MALRPKKCLDVADGFLVGALLEGRCRSVIPMLAILRIPRPACARGRRSCRHRRRSCSPRRSLAPHPRADRPLRDVDARIRVPMLQRTPRTNCDTGRGLRPREPLALPESAGAGPRPRTASAPPPTPRPSQLPLQGLSRRQELHGRRAIPAWKLVLAAPDNGATSNRSSGAMTLLTSDAEIKGLWTLATLTLRRSCRPPSDVQRTSIYHLFGRHRKRPACSNGSLSLQDASMASPHGRRWRRRRPRRSCTWPTARFTHRWAIMVGRHEV